MNRHDALSDVGREPGFDFDRAVEARQPTGPGDQDEGRVLLGAWPNGQHLAQARGEILRGKPQPAVVDTKPLGEKLAERISPNEMPPGVSRSRRRTPLRRRL